MHNPLNPNYGIEGRAVLVYEPYTSTAQKTFSGRVDTNLLFAMGLDKRESTLIADRMEDFAFKQQLLKYDQRSIFLDQIDEASTIYVDTDRVHWYVANIQADYMTLQEARGQEPGVKYGVIGTKFEIVLETAALIPNNTIIPKGSNDIHIRITKEARPAGGNLSLYEAELVEGGRYSYIPEEFLRPGHTQFDVLPAFVSEGSDVWNKGFASPDTGKTYYRLEATVGEFGYRFEVTDKVLQKGGSIIESYEEKHPEKGYIPKPEWGQIMSPFGVVEYRAQVKKAEDNVVLWGKYTEERYLDKSTNDSIVDIDGLFEILKYASVEEYPLGASVIDRLSGFIESAPFHLQGYNPETSQYIMYCGIDLMLSATRDIASRVDRRGTNYNMDNHLMRTNRDLFGRDVYENRVWNYDTWNFDSFGSVRFVHLPELDSSRLSEGYMNPTTGRPISSSMGFVVKVGSGQGMNWDLGKSANIKKLRRSNTEREFWLVSGTTPLGAWRDLTLNQRNTLRETGSISPSHSRRTSYFHKNTSIGLAIHDVSEIMVFKPAYGRFFF